MRNPEGSIRPEAVREGRRAAESLNSRDSALPRSDEDYAKYAAAQNATDQGITAPVANDQNGDHPSGNIMCGSSVCGTVTYGEAPSQDVTDSLVNLGLAVWGVGRAAVSFGSGLVEGAVSDLLGTGAEETSRDIARGAIVDANKLFHIFGNPAHNLTVLVQTYGSEQAAYNALLQATEQTVASKGLTGVFETTVQVGGESVTVRGAVVGGVVKIGTAFK
jgi:hypothetical protein